jgi:hypothetical protein
MNVALTRAPLYTADVHRAVYVWTVRGDEDATEMYYEGGCGRCAQNTPLSVTGLPSLTTIGTNQRL